MATDKIPTSPVPTEEENRMTEPRARVSGLRRGACLGFVLAGCTSTITGSPSGGSGASAGTAGGTTAKPGTGGGSSATGGSAAATATGGTGNTGTGGSGGGNGGTASAMGGNGAGTSTACGSSAPTAVPFRVMTRLNRVEYDNTVRDL